LHLFRLDYISHYYQTSSLFLSAIQRFRQRCWWRDLSVPIKKVKERGAPARIENLGELTRAYGVVSVLLSML